MEGDLYIADGIRDTLEEKRSVLTSKQTHPKAYTSLAGVRVNLSPERPGSSNSGAIQ
jgi:hypothetical protein